MTSGSDVGLRRAAVAGVILVAPPLWFGTAAILEQAGWDLLFRPFRPLYLTPERLRMFNLVSPVVFLGGALAAFALNLVALVRAGRLPP